MKIMFAVATYWPFQDGVAHVTKYLAEGLAGRGHEVYIYTSTGNQNRSDLPQKETHNGVKVERIRLYTRWPVRFKGLNSESNAVHYFKRIQEINPDVLIVVCAQTWTLDWIAPYLERLKCKKIFYSHGFSALKDKYNIKEELKKKNVLGAYIEYRKKLYFQSLYKVIEKFDKAIYISDIEKGYQYVLDHGLKNGIILENAIEEQFLSNIMQHDNKDETEEFQILCVANYNENKNQELLIRAFAKAEIGKSKVIFVGSAETLYLSALRKTATELLRDNPEKRVEFNVGIDRDEIYELYKKADIYVCTSKSETFSLVLYEAAATGMPVVSTRVGIAEKMEGIILIEKISDLVKNIEILYSNQELRKEKGNAVRNYVKTLNPVIDDKISELERIISSL